MINLVRVYFRVPIILSTCPELWFLKVQCNFQFASISLTFYHSTWVVMTVPWSKLKGPGNSFLGYITSSIFLTTVCAISNYLFLFTWECPEKYLQILVNIYILMYLVSTQWSPFPNGPLASCLSVWFLVAIVALIDNFADEALGRNLFYKGFKWIIFESPCEIRFIFWYPYG